MGSNSFLSVVYPLFSDSNNGYACVSCGRAKVLISTNTSFGNVHRGLSAINNSVSGVSTILVARRRRSRVGKLGALLGGAGAGLLTSRTALRTLVELSGVPGGARIVTLNDRTFRVSNVVTSHFTADRSYSNSDNCGFLVPSKGEVTIYASDNVVADSVRGTLANYSTILLRSGRSLSVLGGNPCPPRLGIQVLSSGKRLSGGGYTTRLVDLLGDNAAHFVLKRLDRRGGAPVLTGTATRTILVGDGTRGNESCVLAITGPRVDKIAIV